jgi:hypothetical protein
MRHPFDGIEEANPASELITWTTTEALHEQGGTWRPRPNKQDDPTTEALYEEGGRPVVTTAAMNEEG